MDHRAYNLLTPRERDCLRLLAREREPHEIAAELGISPGTLANHVKNARAKLGGIGRYQAARSLRTYEAALADGATRATAGSPEPVQTEASPPKDMPKPTGFNHPFPGRPMVGVETAREERSHYIFEGHESPRRRDDSRQLGGLQTALLIVTLIAMIGVVASLAYPLSEGAQHLANLIASPHD